MAGMNISMHENSTEPRIGVIGSSVQVLGNFVVLKFTRAGAGEIELYLHHAETAKLIAESATEAHIALNKIAIEREREAKKNK